MPKAYSDIPISKFCYATDINKIVFLREIKYTKEMSPIFPCDNFLCQNHPECLHNRDNNNFHGEIIDYLTHPKQSIV